MGRGAIELSKLVIPIEADGRGVAKDLEETSGHVRRWAQGFAGHMQTIGKVAIGAMAAATGAVAGLAVGIGKLAIDAAQYYSVRDSFQNMTKGMIEDVGTWEQQVIASSGNTIGRFEVMSQATRAFAMIGAESFHDFGSQFEDMTVVARQAGRSLGLDTGEVLEKVVQAMGSGNMQLLRTLGIMPDVEAATAALADELGIAVGELTDTEISTARVNAVMDAMQGAFGDVEVTAGGLGGALAEVKSWWADLRLEIGLQFMPVLNTLVRTVFPLVQQGLEAAAPYIDLVAEFAQKAAEGFQTFVEQLMAGEQPLDALREGLGVVFDEETVARIMGVVDGVIEFAQAAWDVIQPVMQWVSENVGLIDVLVALAAAIGVAVALLLGPVIVGAMKVVAVFALVTATVALLRSAWESNFLGIRGVTAAVIGFVRNFIEGSISAVRGFWEANGEAILASAQQVWTTIQAVVTGVLGAVQAVIGAVTGVIQGIWAQHGDALTAAAQNTWELVLSIVERVTAIVEGVIGFFTNAIKGDFEAAGASLRQVWDNLWGLIGDIVSTAVQNIRTTFSSVDWRSVGRSIIEGIVAGLKGAGGLIVDAARNAARSAFDAAKGFLGMGSPAKLFIPMGASMPEGMAKGVLDNLDTIEKAMAQAVDVSVGAVRQPMRALPVGAGGHTYNYNNTYNVTGKYKYQDEVTITDKIRFLSMMDG